MCSPVIYAFGFLGIVSALALGFLSFAFVIVYLLEASRTR